MVLVPVLALSLSLGRLCRRHTPKNDIEKGARSETYSFEYVVNWDL